MSERERGRGREREREIEREKESEGESQRDCVRESGLPNPDSIVHDVAGREFNLEFEV